MFNIDALHKDMVQRSTIDVCTEALANAKPGSTEELVASLMLADSLLGSLDELQIKALKTFMQNPSAISHFQEVLAGRR